MKALLPFALNYDHQDILTIKRKSVKENKDNKNPLKKTSLHSFSKPSN